MKNGVNGSISEYLRDKFTNISNKITVLLGFRYLKVSEAVPNKKLLSN
jgi:hypothetical protein